MDETKERGGGRVNFILPKIFFDDETF